MNIIIAGAGELGRLLATKLTSNLHDVVLIDTSVETLEHINESLDVRLIEGSCLDLEVLRNAGAATADVVLAVSGDDAVNILCCQLASRLGSRKTICRVNNASFFSKEGGNLTPESFGIWKFVSPPTECVRKILSILEDRFLYEEIRFSHPDAVMRVFEIAPSSLLAGTRIKDIPAGNDLMQSIRFAGLIREKQFLIPHGDTILVPGDKIYIAGLAERVRDFIRWASTDDEYKRKLRVVIVGATPNAVLLAKAICNENHDVRVIEKSRRAGEKFSDFVPAEVLVINGSPTNEEVLREAGAADCDAFISTAQDDEDNILSCIIAKRLGAKKTIPLTSKPEYIRIAPTMDMIDCAISSTLVAVNSVLRLLETGTMRVDAYLQMHYAQLTEFRVSNSSPLCGKSLACCKLPPSTLLALLFRDNEVITPSGGTVLQPGDIVVAIVTRESEKELLPLFPQR